jgi:hypothetical protein
VKKIETEKVTFDLPKTILDFLRAQRINPKEYGEYSFINTFAADLDASGYAGPFNDIKHLTEKFNLVSVFKAAKLWPLPSTM